MLRKRFPVACLSSVALALAAPVHAQSAPAASPAKVNDIKVSRDGDTVSILVTLSQQPSAASAKGSDTSLILEIDGVQLASLALTPPAGSLVTSVSAGANKITLSGAAFSNATTIVYRNAVLVEARLAEPVQHGGSSLLAAATLAPGPSHETPSAPQTLHPAPHPTVQKPAAAPLAAPAPAMAAPPALTPPSPNAPIALASPAAKPAQAVSDLKTHAAATPLAQPAALAIASIGGIDTTRCMVAAAELAKDAWALTAMGDQALCLLDAGMFEEARARLDQLAAITPLDWRVALGFAALHEHEGKTDLAMDSWRAALARAPGDTIRAAIRAKMPPMAAAQSKSRPGDP